MNPQDVSNAILLRESGELSAQECAELDAYLHEHPEAASLSRDYALLQDAGRFASQETVQPISDLELERIRSHASRNPKAWFPPAFAAAAAVVILFFALPLLSPPTPTTAPAPVVVVHHPTPDVTVEVPDRDAEWLEEDVWEEVASLEAELSAWESLSLEDPWLVEDEADWVAELLNTGDSI